MPKLLTLLSNPDDTVKLRMDREIKEVLARISPLVSHDFNCLQVPAITIDELPALLIRERPQLMIQSTCLIISGKSSSSKNNQMENFTPLDSYRPKKTL